MTPTVSSRYANISHGLMIAALVLFILAGLTYAGPLVLLKAGVWLCAGLACMAAAFGIW